MLPPYLLAGLLAGFSLALLSETALSASALRYPALGFTIYFLLDHTVHPLCAYCQQHKANSHWPLLGLTAALSLHSLADGALLAANPSLRWPVLLHWLPETLAVASLLRSLAPAPFCWWAFAFLQAITLLGFLSAQQLPFAGEVSLVATGALTYLAVHALHETYARSPRQFGLAAGCAGVVLYLLQLQ